jgi:hypothetical protein
MNTQITLTMTLAAALLLLCGLYMKNASQRQVARVASKEKWYASLDAGRCPVCDGKPFDQILMNGCTGCVDCASTGRAGTYIARRI